MNTSLCEVLMYLLVSIGSIFCRVISDFSAIINSLFVIIILPFSLLWKFVVHLFYILKSKFLHVLNKSF